MGHLVIRTFDPKLHIKLLSRLTLRDRVNQDNETISRNDALLKAPVFGSLLPGSWANPHLGTAANDVWGYRVSMI